MRVADNQAESAISPIVAANGFEALGDQSIFDLLGAVLVALAFIFWTDKAPPSFQSTLLLDQYFCKRRNFILSKDFFSVICIQVMALVVILFSGSPEIDYSILLGYIISIFFMVGVVLCAFYSVRKTLVSGRLFQLAPMRFVALCMPFPASVFRFSIYRPPCFIKS